MIWRKKIGLVMLLFCFGLELGAVTYNLGYVLGLASSTTFTISGGIYPGAPSYTVWTEGNYYFAKNNAGVLAYSGTNASQIINYAIGDVPSPWYEVNSVKVVGDVVLTSPILIHDQRGFVFEFESLRVESGYNQPIIQVIGDYNHRGIKIFGRSIVVDSSVYTSSALEIKASGVMVEIGHINGASNMGNGIKLTGDPDTNASYFNDIHVAYIDGFYNGVYLRAENYQTVSHNMIRIDMIYSSTSHRGVVFEQAVTSSYAVTNTVFRTCLEACDTPGNSYDVGYWNNGTGYGSGNTILDCYVVDLTVDGKSIVNVNSGKLWVQNGEMDLQKTSITTGTTNTTFNGVTFAGLKSENAGVATISSSTTVTVTHHLILAPWTVALSSGNVASGMLSWTGNSTHIIITSANSGSWTIYWFAKISG